MGFHGWPMRLSRLTNAKRPEITTALCTAPRPATLARVRNGPGRFDRIRSCRADSIDSVRTFSTSSRARGARRAPFWRVIPHEATHRAGGAKGGLARRGGRKRPRDTHRDWAGSSALAPCGARRSCRPCAASGTVRHQPAVVTPADRALWERPSSRRSSLEPTQDHRQERYGLRPPRPADGAPRHSGL
jgi:hypothetical protein